MFKNYFKTAWRNLWKQRVFSYINLGGLAIGIAAVLLIGIYIQSELTNDNFQANRNNTYRVGFHLWHQGVATESSQFTAPFSVEAQSKFPEIKSYCRISENHEAWFSYADKSLKTSGITYADSSFFHFFSFKLLSGNPSTVLQNPYSIVLSENLANKIFGNTDAVGKTLSRDGKTAYLITGIAQNSPPNSTVQYDALVSMSTLYHDTTLYMDWNGGWQYSHYLQLQTNAQEEVLEKKFKDFMWANFNEKYAGTGRVDAYLQPFSKIHLYYDADSENTRTNLYVFGIIALLILFISCINYVNLSVARASVRFKEIGVRKVLGALRVQLIKQFMGETFLVTLVALTLAAFLAIALFPVYQKISGKNILINSREIIFITMMILALIIMITIVAGGYLSFQLSSLNPITSLKMQLPKSTKQKLAKALIVVQFTITAALISSILIVQMQLNFIKNKPLGFDKKHLIVLSLTGNEVRDKSLTLKQQVTALADVTSVSAMSEIPYNDITQNGFLPEGRKDYMMFHQLDADQDLLKTMGIELVSGNYFSNNNTLNENDCIINQALADKLGWKEPLNKKITRGRDYRVIGIVKDFHFASMHDRIEPLIITNKPWLNRYGFLAIKYNSENPSHLINRLQKIWKQNASGAPFEYWFLDEAYNDIYKSEAKFRQLFFCFSMLSILLSLAGVFGLVLLNIQQKTKEIGIRKVLGAGIPDIIKMTAGNFVVLIALASIIAIPGAWYYAGNWLQNFAYRIELHWWIFALSGVVVLLFAIIIISLQTAKAAMANPVNSLRAE